MDKHEHLLMDNIVFQVLHFLSVYRELANVRVQRRQDEENENHAALADSSMTSLCFSSQLSSV